MYFDADNMDIWTRESDPSASLTKKVGRHRRQNQHTTKISEMSEMPD